MKNCLGFARKDAVFGNVNYHKRQAEELRAQLEDLGSEHEFPRGNCITPSLSSFTFKNR